MSIARDFVSDRDMSTAAGVADMNDFDTLNRMLRSVMDSLPAQAKVSEEGGRLYENVNHFRFVDFTIESGPEGEVIITASPSFKGARIKRSATVQNIPDNAATLISFDTEVWDTNAYADLGTNADRFTVAENAYFLVSGSIRYDANITQYRLLTIHQVRAGANIESFSQITEGFIVDTHLTFAYVFKADAGDYFRLETKHNAGVALDCNADMTITKIAKV